MTTGSLQKPPKHLLVQSVLCSATEMWSPYQFLNSLLTETCNLSIRSNCIQHCTDLSQFALLISSLGYAEGYHFIMFDVILWKKCSGLLKPRNHDLISGVSIFWDLKITQRPNSATHILIMKTVREDWEIVSLTYSEIGPCLKSGKDAKVLFVHFFSPTLNLLETRDK